MYAATRIKKELRAVVNIRFIKTVEIEKGLNKQLLPKNPQDLKPFYKESGFDMVDNWVNAILRYPCKWQCNQIKTYNLYYVYKPSKHPLSSIYLECLKEKP